MYNNKIYVQKSRAKNQDWTHKKRPKMSKNFTFSNPNQWMLQEI
jgi:hypothetical protein